MDVIFWSSDHISNGISFYRYIGPYKISHWIEKHGYTSQVIDFIVHMNEDQLYNITKKFITDDTLVLGISTTFICNNVYTHNNGTQSLFPEHIEKVAKRIKTEFPKIKIILGGYGSDKIYMSNIPDATIMSYVSPTEDIFLDFLNALKLKVKHPHSKLIIDYNDSFGEKTKSRKWYYDSNNKFYNIETDDFCFKPKDCILEEESLPLDVSRGCIFACRFCNYPHLGKKKLDYIRGMDYLKKEIIYNYNNFKTTYYSILDDTFNDSVDKLKAFYQMTQELPFKIRYSAYIRADLIHRFPETAILLKESGLTGAVHGIESMNPYSSKLIGKAWSGTHAKEFLPKLYHEVWDNKIAQQLNFIIGLPKETEDDLWNTVRWVEDNNMYGMHFNSLNLHTPLQHKNKKFDINSITSEFGKNPEKYGFELLPTGDWKNETWTNFTAFSFFKNISTYIYKSNYQKLNVWYIGNILNRGYDINYIINTPLKDYNKEMLINVKHSIFEKYYNKILNL